MKKYLTNSGPVFIKNSLIRLYRFFKRLNMERIFSSYYLENAWGGFESRSGEGSSLEATAEVRKILPALLENIQIRSMLDAPCGDFYWLKDVPLNLANYTGIDIVAELIKQNRLKYGAPNRQFLMGDLTKDRLPKADLVLCRDCLGHFSFRDAVRAIRNIKQSGSDYLLITTFPTILKNQDIITGAWRPLNLQKPPFNFPEPVQLVNEHYPKSPDKSLGLWKLNDIRT